MDQTLLKKNDKTICWRMLTMDDLDEVERLMKEYCKTEPLAVALYFLEFEAMTMERTKTILSENFSIGAYDLNDKDHLCAVSLNWFYNPSERFDQDLEMAKKDYSSGFSVVFRFELETLKEFQEVVTSQTFLYHECIVTTDKYQRMGITTHLQNKLKKICKDHGCRYIIGVYTSEFSKRASKNLGFQKVGEIKYADYLDPLTNEKPFKDIQFHTSAIGMYYDVEKE